MGKPLRVKREDARSAEDKTQNTDTHKKPNKTQNSSNFTDTSSFVFLDTVLCLDFVYCALECFVFRASRGHTLGSKTFQYQEE